MTCEHHRTKSLPGHQALCLDCDEILERQEWDLVIWGPDGSRHIRLDHEYYTADDAAREAENIADIEFREEDEGWNVFPVSSQKGKQNV